LLLSLLEQLCALGGQRLRALTGPLELIALGLSLGTNLLQGPPELALALGRLGRQPLRTLHPLTLHPHRTRPRLLDLGQPPRGPARAHRARPQPANEPPATHARARPHARPPRPPTAPNAPPPHAPARPHAPVPPRPPPAPPRAAAPAPPHAPPPPPTPARARP